MKVRQSRLSVSMVTRGGRGGKKGGRGRRGAKATNLAAYRHGGKAGNSIASTAYRHGEKLRDIEGKIHDYTYRREKGDIMLSETRAPPGTPDLWRTDRQALWTAVENAEKRKDSQTAREILLSIPHELGEAQQIELVRRFADEQLVSRGMIADIAIHRPDVESGSDQRNVHAHIMTTTRELVDGTFGTCAFGPKNRDWNKRELLNEWRASWCGMGNEALREAGIRDVLLEHRSFKAQGLERIPEIPLGPYATQMERAGVATFLGNENRRIRLENLEREWEREREAAGTSDDHNLNHKGIEIMADLANVIRKMEPDFMEYVRTPTQDYTNAGRKAGDRITTNNMMRAAEKELDGEEQSKNNPRTTIHKNGNTIAIQENQGAKIETLAAVKGEKSAAERFGALPGNDNPVVVSNTAPTRSFGQEITDDRALMSRLFEDLGNKIGHTVSEGKAYISAGMQEANARNKANVKEAMGNMREMAKTAYERYGPGGANHANAARDYTHDKVNSPNSAFSKYGPAHHASQQAQQRASEQVRG